MSQDVIDQAQEIVQHRWQQGSSESRLEAGATWLWLVFDRDESMWPPQAAAIDDPLGVSLIISCTEGSGLAWVGVQHEDNFGVFPEWVASAPGRYKYLISLPSWRGLLDSLGGAPKRSGPVRLVWYVGYKSGEDYYYTDSQETVTQLDVPSGVPVGIPTWAYVAGGMALAGLGLVLVARRR